MMRTSDNIEMERAEYDVYVVNHEAEVSNLFFNAMESAGATWFWRDMPEPYWGERAVFLPRAQPVSMKVSQAFKAAGFEEPGVYLEEVASRSYPEVISQYLPSAREDADGEEERRPSAIDPAPRAAGRTAPPARTTAFETSTFHNSL